MNKLFSLTKDEANIAKGVAIFLMLFHHLFAFPDRYEYLGVTLREDIVQNFALWSKICVPIFLYLSGFAFEKLNLKARDLINKLMAFLKLYWFVLFVFLLIGIATSKINFDVKLVISHVLTISSKYNGEWWFVKLYVELLLILAIIRSFKISSSWVFLGSTVVFFYAVNNRDVYVPFISVQNLVYWQFPFFLGYFASNLVKKSRNIILIPLFSISIVSGIIWFFFKNYFFIILFTPALLVCIKMLSKIEMVRNVLTYAGKQSMFIWLVHTFYCYYYFPDLIYGSNSTVLIFLKLSLVSLVTAHILNFIYESVFTNCVKNK